MVNMYAKFDKEICNGLVSIVFTRSTHGRTEPRTHGRTEPQQRYYIPTATRCAGITKSTFIIAAQSPTGETGGSGGGGGYSFFYLVIKQYIENINNL